MPYYPSTGYYNTGAGRTSGFTDLSGVTSLAGLSDKVNTIYRGAQNEANLARIPNAIGLEAQSSKMIEDELLGKIPADVMALLGSQAGERSVSGGMVGAPNAGAAYLRALGLTSLDQQQRGQQNLSAAYARNPAAPIMQLENQLITPLQQAQLDLDRERLAIERSRLGGGGGGRGSEQPVIHSQGSGGYVPTASSLFGGYGGGGLSYSPDTTWTGPVSPEQAIYDQGGYVDTTPRAWEGYTPTSGGSMYMGSFEGYDPEFADWQSGGWMDDIGG